MDETVLCYDELTCRYFRKSMREIQDAINILNWDRSVFTHIPTFWSSLEDLLDLPNVANMELGWPSLNNGGCLLDFEVFDHVLETGEPCKFIRLLPYPKFIAGSK